MSYNISKKEQHQKKFKIENTSPASVQHSSTEYYYITPSIQQLNLAKMGTKPMPTSLSTKLTSKQASTPGRLSSINPTHLLQTQDNPLLVKSRSQEEKFTIRNKSLSFSLKPSSSICTQSECCSMHLIPKSDCSILHGMKLFSNKSTPKTETPKCGKMPSSRQQEAMPRKRNNARLTGSRTATKDKRPKIVGGILGFKQQNTGKVKFKGSKKKSNERKYKKNKKKQKITPNSGMKSKEETQKKTHTVTGKNQLKKEKDSETKSEEENHKKTHTVTGKNQLKNKQDSEMKSEEETQKKTNTVTGKNQLKKKQDSETKSEEEPQKKTNTITGKNQLKKEEDLDKTILHKDKNF